MLTRLQLERDTGSSLDPSRMTLAAFLAHWLESVIRVKRRQTTYERYEGIIRVQIVPHLGGVAIQKLTPLHLTRLYAALHRAGLSASTIGLAHTVLHSSLLQAYRWQMVARNVAESATPATEGIVRAINPEALWSDDQTRHFLAILKDEPLRAFFVLEINTGLRRGEIIGLRWPAVDLARGEIHIREQRVKVRGGMLVGSPKTASGRRSLVLSPDTAAVLRRYQETQAGERETFGTAWAGADYVFTSPRGKLLYPSYVDKLWRRTEARAGIPHMKFHNLRHLNATLLLNAGIHPKVVQERLGHSSITITLDRYSHVSRDLQGAAAAALDGAFPTAEDE